MPCFIDYLMSLNNLKLGLSEKIKDSFAESD